MEKPVIKEEQLTLSQLVWLATGQVVGAGVVTIVGVALGVTGFSAWFAYTAAVVTGFVRILPYVFFFSALVVPGGFYGMITRACGRQFGGLVTISSLIQWISVGTVVVSIGNYLYDMFPSCNRIALALSVWAFLTLTNLLGVNVMAKIQAFATPCLLFCLFAFSAVCCFHVQPGYLDFSNPDMFTNGLSGWLLAIVLLSYSTHGQFTVSNFATRAINPKRNIPLAMIISTVIIFFLYTAVGFASGAVLPLSKTANATMTDTARYLLPTFLYYVFMFGGPVFALLTTMNSGIMNRAMPVIAGVKEGWLPSVLAKQNRFGAYWVAILLFFVIGSIPICVGMSVRQVTNSVLFLMGFQNCLIIYVSFVLPKKFPKEWKESWLHIPDFWYYSLMIVSAIFQGYIIYRSFFDLNFKLATINAVVLIVSIAYSVYRMRTTKITETDYV